MNQMPVPYEQLDKYAVAIAKSQLFGVKTVEQALALMIVADAEGRHPGTIARDYHIIQGRPTLKADAVLSRFQEAGGSVMWEAYDDKVCRAVFSHPKGGSVTIEWTIERATKAGLAGKDTWKSYPRAMLRSRCITEGIRTVYPVVLCGFMSTEEAADTTPPDAVPQVVRPIQEAVVVRPIQEAVVVAGNSTPCTAVEPAKRGRKPKTDTTPETSFAAQEQPSPAEVVDATPAPQLPPPTAATPQKPGVDLFS